MTKQCSFCYDEIKNQDFSVHYQCNSYFHTHCFTYVKKDSKRCLGCYPRVQNHKEPNVRQRGHSTKIRDLEAKVANLEKNTQLGVELNEAARGDNHGVNRNLPPRAPERQQHYGVNRNEPPIRPIGRQQNYDVNRNEPHRAPERQQHYGGNHIQPPGMPPGRQQNYDVNRNDPPRAPERRHRPDNNEKLILKLAPGQSDCDNAMLNRTMNWVLMPDSVNNNPRIMKVKIQK